MIKFISQELINDPRSIIITAAAELDVLLDYWKAIKADKDEILKSLSSNGQIGKGEENAFKVQFIPSKDDYEITCHDGSKGYILGKLPRANLERFKILDKAQLGDAQICMLKPLKNSTSYLIGFTIPVETKDIESVKPIETPATEEAKPLPSLAQEILKTELVPVDLSSLPALFPEAPIDTRPKEGVIMQTEKVINCGNYVLKVSTVVEIEYET